MRCCFVLQIQASGQLRGIGTTTGHPTARVQSSGMQTVVMSGSTGPQMPLKQGVCKFIVIFLSVIAMY
jgi:hypothetical protein